MARRVWQCAAVRHRSQHSLCRLQRLGRIDLLHELGWKFPKHVFDLHTAYLATSNILLPYNPDEVRKRQRKRLSDACRAYGIPGWESIDKEAISRDIGEGRWRDHGQEAVINYCEEDVRASMLLLRAQLAGAPGSRRPTLLACFIGQTIRRRPSH